MARLPARSVSCRRRIHSPCGRRESLPFPWRFFGQHLLHLIFRARATASLRHAPPPPPCAATAAVGSRLHATSVTTWMKPEAGRLKLNFDGSCKHASRTASIGGVYRDHEGGFLLGYAERIGETTSSVAELVALKRGLQLALENGWRDVWIEGDFETAVDVVTDRARVRSKDLTQCRKITTLLSRLGDMRVSHDRRKGNKVADGFAKLGHKAARQLVTVWRDAPPDEVVEHLQRDAEGK